MIDKSHELPVVRQAQLLELSRSSVYYQAQPTSESDLKLMRRIDELHLEHPFAGARMLRDMLKLEGHEIGRKYVSARQTQVDFWFRRRIQAASDEAVARRSGCWAESASKTGCPSDRGRDHGR